MVTNYMATINVDSFIHFQICVSFGLMRIQESSFVEIKFLTVFHTESLQLCHFNFGILLKNILRGLIEFCGFQGVEKEDRVTFVLNYSIIKM